ncbi:MAG: hypothetical protein KIT31_17800, partial [Deltaproteobacteria bacterium]|nr:hypothetical protein [Deltaproteobacteria bacterium]
DPVADTLARIDEAAAAGNPGRALDLALAARKTFPDDARLAFAAGRQCFTRLWWNDGLRHLRDTIRLDPAYRSNPDLIKTVLRGFLTTPHTNDELAAFLADDLGDAARPFLEETARDHPSAKLRARATSTLRRLR